MIVDKILENKKLTQEDYTEYNSHCSKNNLCPLSHYIETKLSKTKRRK